jgi:hypothetical protein
MPKTAPKWQKSAPRKGFWLREIKKVFSRKMRTAHFAYDKRWQSLGRNASREIVKTGAVLSLQRELLSSGRPCSRSAFWSSAKT